MHVDLSTLKISLIVIIFICGVFGVLSPRLFKPFGSRLSYASLLSSGVLMSAALVHLLGDAADGLEDSPLPKASGGDSYPWAYLFCGLSFYFLYFFEKFVIHSLTHSHSHSHNNNNKSIKLNSNNQKQNVSKIINSSNMDNNDIDNNKISLLHNSISQQSSPYITSQNGDRDDLSLGGPGPGPPLPIDSASIKPLIPSLPPPKPIKQDINDQDSDSISDIDFDDDEHGAEILQLLARKNYLSAIVLLIGLGLHSFLAGVALGSSSDTNSAIALGIAIISHKYLAAFALGCPLYKASMPLLFSSLIAMIFGSLTPCGIGVGWALEQSFDGWVGDMFVSIASGTFIYVSIVEVLIPEFSKEKKEEKIVYRVEQSRLELSRSNTPTSIRSQRLKEIKMELILKQKRKAKRQELFRSLCVICGFGLMSSLAIWV